MLNGFSAQRFAPPLLRFSEIAVNYSISCTQIQSQIKPRASSTTHNDLLNFFDYLLRQCTAIQHCKQVHTQIVVTDTSWSAFLAARLVSVYARFGLVLDAQKVFSYASIEGSSNLLLWNSIMRANVSHGCYVEALELYGKMRELGVSADGFTFPLVIRACAYIGNYNLCRSVHSDILLMGFRNHLHIVNELIGMYSRLGQMDNARKLFDKMGVRSYISWNTMVSGYSFNYDCNGASEMFRRMELEGLEPNPVTWTALLSSHARCGLLEETMELFGIVRIKGIDVTAEVLAVILSVCADLAAFDKGKIIQGYVIKGGFEDYLFAKNALICLYGKCGDPKDAKELFFEMKIKNIVSWNALISAFSESGLCDEAFELFSQMQKSDIYSMVRPNVITWSAVICSFASKGRGEESLEHFRQMQLEKITANSVTISSVLSVCADLAALNLGREIHGHVIRALMYNNILVENGLINMYTKCGNFKYGNLVFEKIEGRDLISWNSMIAGYGFHGLGENALRTFNNMIKSGFDPDEVTFIAVLSACSHAGLVDEGRRVFDQMIRDFKIEPKMEHYACMVDLLGRSGFLQEASDIVKNMPIKPNTCVLGALLNSCRMHKDTDIAEEIGSHIFGLNVDMSGSYMLLSNIFAASGRWDDSARARIEARTKGVRKIPGQSWIEVKKKVYMFTAGDSRQLGLEKYYEILYSLALHMESEGYALDNIIEQNFFK